MAKIVWVVRMKDIIGWIIGGAVIWFIFSAIGGVGKYEGQSAEEWFNQYDEASAKVEDLSTKVENLQTALQEANDHIETANNAIEEVKDSSSFNELRDAAENLETVDTVDEP